MKKMLLTGKSKHDLFLVPIRHTPPYVGSSTKVSSSQCHQHLGHPISTIFKSILKSNNLCFSFNNKSSVCDTCQHEKSNQLPYNTYVHFTSSPLELIHTGVWGPD